MKKLIKKFLQKILGPVIRDAFTEFRRKENEVLVNVKTGVYARLMPPFSIDNSSLGDYSYVAGNSRVSQTTIGKFCSIGPNFLCGWGIHPLHGISTAPMFYSIYEQNGFTLSEEEKVEERKPISIGNDVFIGSNVTILDGVKIGSGAVIGAGAVVSKDIPPYAIAVGCPIRIIRYRFNEDIINKFLSIKWWDFPPDKLKEVEQHFFDIEKFVATYYTG